MFTFSNIHISCRLTGTFWPRVPFDTSHCPPQGMAPGNSPGLVRHQLEWTETLGLLSSYPQSLSSDPIGFAEVGTCLEPKCQGWDSNPSQLTQEWKPHPLDQCPMINFTLNLYKLHISDMTFVHEASFQLSLRGTYWWLFFFRNLHNPRPKLRYNIWQNSVWNRTNRRTNSQCKKSFMTFWI